MQIGSGDHPRLILASASPRRLELLRQIGVTPDQVQEAGIDESHHPAELPRLLAARLAAAKAEAVASTIPPRDPPTLILAADTVVGVGRRILPKAESPEQIAACLKLLSGRRHRVYTGVTVIHLPSLRQHHRLVETAVVFKPLSTAEIDAYITSGEGLGKAGGYAIQGRAAMLVRQIIGSYSNIVGLPLYETAGLLKNYGLLS
ncbi:MAG: Maf family protein [Candidatus Pacebacteria bacterium]|nr:Maf family protein [Candidatus Paceibacterota bacterium]